jgi:hypothetical protein
MKTLQLVTIVGALAFLPAAQAQKDKGTLQFPKPPPTTPPPSDYVVQPPPPPLGAAAKKPAPSYVFDQKPAAGRPAWVTSEQAQTIIDRFKAAYPKLGSPRFLIYVNREMVNDQTASTNSGAAAKSPPTRVDPQTVRDVERLFGRPLLAAGVGLVDPKAAAELIADKPLDDFIGSADTPQSRKDREALGKVADAVIEVLLAAKTVSVPAPNTRIPEIQATAITLKDSKIIGQTSSGDVTSRVPPAGLGGLDVREITEATALMLMEDMTPNP